MVRIGGRPIIEHQIDLLHKYGIKDIYITVGYLRHLIMDHLGDGKTFGVNIKYLQEVRLLGTSGSIKGLEKEIQDDFLVLYGDLMLNVKLDDFITFHETKGGAATLIVHPSDHPYDSDLVVTEDESRITRILSKPSGVEYYGNLGSAAIYLLSPVVFRYIPAGEKSDFMKDIFPEMLRRSEELYAYKTAEYIKDIGTAERLAKVSEDFQAGKIDRLSKDFKRPAIFIDRDGTLAKDTELLHKVEDLELYEFSLSAVGKVNSSDYLCIVVTNQSVVARNLCDISTLNRIHTKVETLLGRDGAYLDDIFFCPHHPDTGYPGENSNYKTDCECRKPKLGMIEKAALRHNVEIGSSWFIGDSTTDIQTGVNAGIKTILLRTGKGGKDGKYQAVPDFVFNDLMEGVEFILTGERKLVEAAMEVISHIDLANSLRVIIVGGLARSGKSTFVKCLQDCLQRQDVSVTVISLDNWLLSTGERRDTMTVRERYKYKEIETDIEKLLNGGEIQISAYDPYSRNVLHGNHCTLDKEGWLIVEGVPALDIEGLRSISDIRVYCEIQEHERKERFVAYYRWKDLPESMIHQLYERRISDELPIIESSKEYADFVIHRDGLTVCRQS